MRIFFGILFSFATIVGLKVCYTMIFLMPSSRASDPIFFIARVLAVLATAACLNAAIRNYWLTNKDASVLVLASVFGLLGMLLIAALVVLFYVVSRLGH